MCTAGPNDPTETEPELCLSVSCGGTGQQWPAAGEGLWLQQTLVWHKPLFEEVTLTPPHSHQNLHWTGETNSWRAQTKPCAHQDPGESSSDPTRDWPRLSCECPEVSRRGMGQQWPAAGLEALSVAVCAWDLLRELAILSLPPPQFGLRSNNREGTQLCPSTVT